MRLLHPLEPSLFELVLYSSLVFTSTNSLPNTISDPASLVNLFIGTTNGGHVFPGATLPHGMAKVGMDTNSPGNVDMHRFALRR